MCVWTGSLINLLSSIGPNRTLMRRMRSKMRSKMRRKITTTTTAARRRNTNALRSTVTKRSKQNEEWRFILRKNMIQNSGVKFVINYSEIRARKPLTKKSTKATET